MHLTRKRELENYVRIDCLDLPSGCTLSFDDTDDVKKIINEELQTKQSIVLEKYWKLMTAEQIREVEKYCDDNEIERYEFTDAFNDFLSLIKD